MLMTPRRRASGRGWCGHELGDGSYRIGIAHGRVTRVDAEQMLFETVAEPRGGFVADDAGRAFERVHDAANLRVVAHGVELAKARYVPRRFFRVVCTYCGVDLASFEVGRRLRPNVLSAFARRFGGEHGVRFGHGGFVAGAEPMFERQELRGEIAHTGDGRSTARRVHGAMLVDERDIARERVDVTRDLRRENRVEIELGHSPAP